jgi:hypothetical protein
MGWCIYLAIAGIQIQASNLEGGTLMSLMRIWKARCVSGKVKFTVAIYP